MPEDITENKLYKLQDALVFIGFTKDESEKQIDDLNKLVSIGIINKIIEENQNEDLNEANIGNFIKNKYSEEEIENMSAEISEIIIEGYFDDITKDLSESRKKYFYKFLE